MANTITRTNLRPQDGFVPQTSRYINSEIIYYGDEGNITFTTYKKNNYPNNSADQFAVIPASMQYRPDLVSYKYYGLVDFWWKIMEANEIKDVFDFVAGKTIRLPANIF